MPQSYLEDPSQRGIGCTGTQKCIRYTEYASWIFISHRIQGFPPVLNKQITKPVNSLLVHRHEICPLAETTLSFPTEKGEKDFFIALLGDTPLSREVLRSKEGSDATFTTTLINDSQWMQRWSDISQLGQSASKGSQCAPGPYQSWGEQLQWLTKNSTSFALL